MRRDRTKHVLLFAITITIASRTLVWHTRYTLCAQLEEKLSRITPYLCISCRCDLWAAPRSNHTTHGKNNANLTSKSGTSTTLVIITSKSHPPYPDPPTFLFFTKLFMYFHPQINRWIRVRPLQTGWITIGRAVSPYTGEFDNGCSRTRCKILTSEPQPK